MYHKTKKNYIGNEKDDHKRVSDLAPKDQVPLDPTTALELVSSIATETNICLFRGEALDAARLEFYLGLGDGVGVVGDLWLQVDDLFRHGGEEGVWGRWL